MMDLYEILTELNIEIAYHHFSKPVVPPFIAYYRIESKNFVADDKVYEKISRYRIEIYTKKKDITTEVLLEDLLDANGITYDVVSENFIESEKMYQVVYEVEI